MSALIETWLAAKRLEGLGDETLAGYRRCVAAFCRYLDGREITPDLLHTFIGGLPFGDKTKRNYFTANKIFIRWAQKKHLLPADCIDGVRFRWIQHSLSARIPLETVLLTIDAIPRRDDIWAWRDWALFSTTVFLGARRMEVRPLTNACWSRSTGRILLNGKGRKSRCVPVPASLVSRLDQWLAINPFPVWFPGIRNPMVPMPRDEISHRWQMWQERLHVTDPVRFHDLRHCYAGQMLAKTGDILRTSKLLGHSDISTTARHYGHLDDDSMSDVVDKAFAGA